MVATVDSPCIDMDIRVALTPTGVDTFVRNNHPFSKFRVNKEYDVAGVQLTQFSADSIQKLIRSGMVESVDIPSIDVRQKRSDVIDLTKIIAYGLLYVQFAHEVYQDLVRSPLTTAWNRRNVRYAIDNETRVPAARLKTILREKREGITRLQNEILRRMQAKVLNDELLSREEAGRRMWSAEKFVRTIDPIVWLLLLVYADNEESRVLEDRIEKRLEGFLRSTVFSDYLALLVIELMSYLQSVSKDGSNASVVWKIRKKLDRPRDRAKLHIVLAGERTSFGTIWAQFVERNNRNQNDSLERFYAEACLDTSDSLGLYYSAFLGDACRGLGVSFESFVNQPPNSPSALINLVVHLGDNRE